jgi:hypothetical protein
VLLIATCLLRRADAVKVIGMALVAKVTGAFGHPWSSFNMRHALAMLACRRSSPNWAHRRTRTALR